MEEVATVIRAEAAAICVILQYTNILSKIEKFKLYTFSRSLYHVLGSFIAEGFLWFGLVAARQPICPAQPVLKSLRQLPTIGIHRVCHYAATFLTLSM